MKKILVIVILTLAVITFQNCSKSDKATTEVTTPNLPATAYNYIISYPTHIQNDLTINDNTPGDNSITNDGATLGRVLYM